MICHNRVAIAELGTGDPSQSPDRGGTGSGEEEGRGMAGRRSQRASINHEGQMSDCVCAYIDHREPICGGGRGRDARPGLLCAPRLASPRLASPRPAPPRPAAPRLAPPRAQPLRTKYGSDRRKNADKR
ncbi:hypothetical protein R5R35_006146 [Gryllus longicercus]|uniref:Uncharacterized protein n=1 Tax=Gryllus longicercus TaxID=2509291 RepID=A0AAN9VEN1_9ORTH